MTFVKIDAVCPKGGQEEDGGGPLMPIPDGPGGIDLDGAISATHGREYSRRVAIEDSADPCGLSEEDPNEVCLVDPRPGGGGGVLGIRCSAPRR